MPGAAVGDGAGGGHDYCQWRGRYQPSSRTEAFGEGKVSYDAETNTLTINGGLTNAGSPTATVIQGNGTTDVKIDGGESPAAFGLTVTGAKNVTVTANSNSPAIYGSSTGVGANITCSGDVEITNEGSGQVVYGSLSVNGAQNVTVTANGNSPAIYATNIACSGDVSITNNMGGAVSGTLTVNGVDDKSAQNVTVTANSGSPAISQNVSIACSGDAEITNEGSGQVVYGSLSVNGAQNVTVTANGNSPAITNDVIITCSGDVEIANNGNGSVVFGTLTVTGAKDVTVTANSGGPAIGSFFAEFGADITCSGDVEITNNGVGQAVGYTLFVHSAQNVKVTANSYNFAINNGAEIACSGNVEITNSMGGAVIGSLTVNRAQDVTVTANNNQAVSQKLTVKDAQNVTVTVNLNGYANINAINYVDITCSGDVEIVNQGTGKAVGYTLTFQQSNGHSYTVKTGSPESLDVYVEKAAGETFNVESLNASAVKIESADHTPGEWEHNRTQHWQVCTACGAELDRADHTFIGRTCTVCGYTKPSTSGGVSTYAINVESAENGTVTMTPKTAARGVTVTLTVEPDKGYTLETLTVTDKNGNEIELTNKGDGKYTFTMPASKVTVKATFMEDNSMLNFFVDVPADAYYYDAVLWAVENGVTEGTNADGTLFSPNDPCTRAQVVTFLWRAAGSPEPESLRSFADVSADSYYAKAVAWAVENGITTGTGDGLFSPDAVCSRAQIVTFLWRAQQSPAAGSGNPFLDVAADAYYTDAVLWAVENGVTMGTNAEGTAFSPDDDCTRAQIVTFLYRCLGGE